MFNLWPTRRNIQGYIKEDFGELIENLKIGEEIKRDSTQHQNVAFTTIKLVVNATSC